MTKRFSLLLRWTYWIALTLLLLPFASLILIKLTGSLQMRQSDDVILGNLHSYPLEKKIDTLVIGKRYVTYLHTWKDNRKKADAIVFVHGSPGSMDAYVKYMHNDSLLSIADLITYDRPGFGHSDFGKALPSLRGQAAVLQDLMKKLDYQRYWLIGHSYGGAIILQTVIDNPERIQGLGIIAGSVNFSIEPKAGWRKWIDLPFIRVLMPYVLRVSNDELMSLRKDLRMIDDDWNTIKVPVSIMHGTKDALVSFENVQVSKEKLINADTVRTLVFEDDNHFILWTQTEQIIEEILKLMTREHRTE